MKHLVKIIALGGFLVLALAPLHEEEGGAGHCARGGAATLIALLPTKPGFILQPIYTYYKGDAEGSRSYPVAGKITANLEAKSNSVTLGALYTFDDASSLSRLRASRDRKRA